MGQAFRRASGRIRSTNLEPPSSTAPKKAVDSRPPLARPDKVAGDSFGPVSGPLHKKRNVLISPFVAEVEPRINAENILEERDPQYDVMLNQMVGRIKSKPGGKLEMGEGTLRYDLVLLVCSLSKCFVTSYHTASSICWASVVENYRRPLPKLRNTNMDSSRYEERPVPPGTLNVAQLRHVILLHQGKADDHDGPMDIHQIAEKFRVDVVQIQKILQSVSLPPEDSSQHRNDR
ncbi:unnamed protein product [Camellia sinensis]